MLSSRSITGSTNTSSHAVVIGAGMGGLAAARVLASHFDRVTILERDVLDNTFDTRRGVPQGAHAHALLARGLEQFESFFPGLRNDLVAAGGSLGDASNNMHWRQFGHLHARRPTGITALLSTRGLVETVVRRRLVQFNNIHLRDGVAVCGLTWSEDRSRVTGVQACPTGNMVGNPVDLAADLVVDATGRGSKLAAWLAAGGHPIPVDESVPALTRYATRRFRAPFDMFGETRIAVEVTSPGQPKGGLATAQEHGMWTVMLVGRGGVVPPTDLPGFTAFARELASPEIAAIIEVGEPLDSGTSYHFPASLRRRYDQLDQFPAGILPFADSICSFNPVYGQGMTIAILEAGILDRCLEQGTIGLFARFMAGANPTIDSAWKLAASGDLPFAMERSEMPRSLRFIGWYMRNLHAAAGRDPEVAVAFAKVVHVLSPPSSVMAPGIAARVARDIVRRSLTRDVPAPATAIEAEPRTA